MSLPQRQPIRVLVLDGGGQRGLCSLLMLREIMQRVECRTHRPLRPADCFELIVGTGIGGISALLIGRMRMTVDEAIREYMGMADSAFRPPTISFHAKVRGQLPSLDGNELDLSIADIAKRHLHDMNALLHDSSTEDSISHCRTAVLAAIKDSADAPPVIFRSYSTTHPPSSLTIREVARATAATASINCTVKLGNPPVEYINAGSVGWNNPTLVALDEVSELWPGAKVDCLISLGTGRQKIVNFDGSCSHIAESYNALLQNCERVHDEVSRRQDREDWQYFRFNVDQGLEDVGIDWLDKGHQRRLTGITEASLRWFDITRRLDSCVHTLVGGESAPIPAVHNTRHISQALETIDEQTSLAELRRMIPTKHSYDPAQACLENTRQRILQKLEDWVKDTNGSENFLWLHGLAGSGKSAIASSIAARFGRLGTSFFCKRDDPGLRDPTIIIPAIASRLSIVHRPFRKLLAAALREDPDFCKSAIQLQFDGLIRGPLAQIVDSDVPAPLVIIVDALDECEGESTRRQLLHCLLELSSLVRWMKVIVTSRPNADIKATFNRTSQKFCRLDLDAEDSFDDIVRVAQKRLEDIANDKYLPPDWPGYTTTKELSRRASGLFIWIQTACKFISEAMDPDQHLEVVLSVQSTKETSYTPLDELYKAVLMDVFGNSESNAQVFQNVIGAVVAVSTRTPLSVDALGYLLEDVKASAVATTIRALGAVLYEDGTHGGAVRVCHPSFVDFLTDLSRSSRFFIDLRLQDTRLACRCLQTMCAGLVFNICGLESSYDANTDIPDLHARVERAIPVQLRYGCLHWTSHVSEASKATEHVKKVLRELDVFFSGPRRLYWLEVLSLIGELRVAPSGLLQVVQWLQEPAKRYAKVAVDLQRFVKTFYKPMSQSSPHIYVSALPFTPRDTPVHQLLSSFPNCVCIPSGLRNNWPTYLQLCEGHQDWVLSVAFSPDGSRVVSGSCDRTVRLWDAETGAAVGEPLRGHRSDVTSVAFSPDCRRIVSGSSDGTVRLWDADTGAALGEAWRGHGRAVTSVAFSPDCRQLVSGSTDMTVRLWDVDTGATIGDPLRGHKNFVTSVAFSPDGRRVVSGSNDQTIRLWDVETGAAIGEPLRGHEFFVTSVAFSPDCSRVVSGSYDKMVRLWDVETGAAAGEPLRGHHDYVTSVAISPDGSRVVSGSNDKTVRIWDAETGATAGECLQGHDDYVTSVAISPDGGRAVSGSHDRTVRIWDTQTSAGVVQGHLSWVMSVAFSADGRRVASGSHDKTVRLWDAQTGAPVACFRGHHDFVLSVAFSADGRQLLSYSRDNEVWRWDTVTSEAVGEPLRLVGRIISVAFSPDCRQLVSGSTDMTVRLWDVDTGTTIGDPMRGHENFVTSVAFSSDGRRLVSGSDDWTVRLWDVETGAAIGEPLRGHKGDVTSVAFSPDCRRVVSGSKDGTVHLWDTDTGSTVGEALRGHEEQVTSVAFSPDGRRVVSGSDDRTVRVWNVETLAAIGDPLWGHENFVTSVAFSPDGRRIVSGSDDSTVRLWESEISAAVSESRKRHLRWATCVAFSPEGYRVVSGSYDKTVRLWDVDTGATIGDPMRGHEDFVTSVAFSPDGRRLVSGSDDWTVRLWDVETGAAIGEPLRGHGDQITSVAFSPDCRRVVSGSKDRTVHLWDVGAGATVGEALRGHEEQVTSVAFSSDGRRVVSGSYDRTVRVWNVETCEAIGNPLRHLEWVTSVAFSPDGCCVVSGSHDKTVRLWDVEAGDIIGEPLLGHYDCVTSVAFSPDGSRVVSGSNDKTVRLWNANFVSAVGEPLQRHESPVISVSFSPDGSRIMSGSADQLRFWDVSTGATVGPPPRVQVQTQPTDFVSQTPPLASAHMLVEDDGWIRLSGNKLLLWIPPEYRPRPPDQSAICMPNTPRVIFNFQNFRHGASWADIHNSSSLDVVTST